MNISKRYIRPFSTSRLLNRTIPLVPFTNSLKQCRWSTSERQRNLDEDTDQCSFSQNSQKHEILRRALVYVPDDGFSDLAILKAADELKLPPLASRIVDRGPLDLIDYSVQKRIMQVDVTIKNTINESQEYDSTRFNQDRLIQAIEEHFRLLLPFKNVWAEAIALSLSPSEIERTSHNMLKLTDNLCYYANIQSTRLAWYSERALMTSLYGAVELYFLTDNSADFADTKEFIKRGVAQLDSTYALLRKF